MVKGMFSVAYPSLRSMVRQEKSDLRCLMIYESIMNFLGGVVVFLETSKDNELLLFYVNLGKASCILAEASGSFYG